MSIYEKKFTVDCFDIGENNKFLNLGFLKMMQNIASTHSKDIEKTIGKTKKDNIGWVITNWKLQVTERPKENEVITIKTWLSKINKLYFYREFEVFNEEGNCIAKAESKWIWFDIDDRAVVRVDDETRKLYEGIIEDREGFPSERIKKDCKSNDNEFNFGTEYRIMRRDIDLNHHVNNLNYLLFANEAITEDLYRMGEPNNIEITYKKELMLGDTIECMYKKIAENEYNIVIQNIKTKEINAVIKYIY